MSAEQYDIIVIGNGAGGGTLTYKLAASGKKILLLERGEFLPREKENWDTVAVFHRDRYHAKESWLTRNGSRIHPGTGYWVGGNTKVYGAALLRFRERDFERVIHKDGISPEWPLKYNDYERFYDETERLYQVQGLRGEDPTEPWRERDYPLPPISHEPRIAALHARLQEIGLNPFHLPLGIKLNEQDRRNSACIRCNTCDGFPCLVDAKADSDINCVRPALRHPNVTLLTGTRVLGLETSASGREVTGVVAEQAGQEVRFRGDIVAVSCGAVNSAVLLLRSANDRHPEGLANRSGQVGRNFMKHTNGAVVGVSTKVLNPTVFQKTLAVNDFYWGEKDYEFPMGHVQLLGKVNKDMLALDAPRIAPGFALDEMAHRLIDWWLTTEDLPNPENRVRLKSGEIQLDYEESNLESFNRLMERWNWVLKEADCGCHIFPHSVYFKKRIPLEGVAHQCGTCRFGDDPNSSVLDTNCRAHDVDNLYVVDASLFPLSAAVNPSLTVMANALRVGEHLLERMG